MSDRVERATVVVGQVGNRELLADLYRPPVSNRASVLLIHGGSFERGDRTQLRGYGIALGRAGFTSMACEYRLAGEAKWPAQIDDVLTALSYLHANSESLELDPSKIAVSGNSAGGCLSLLATGLQRTPVAAAVAFYAPVNFLGRDARTKGAPEAMSYLTGDDVSVARLAAMSPLNYVHAKFPPTMLITGNDDALVDWRESVAMHDALRAMNIASELHIFDSAPHAFDAEPDYGRACAGLLNLFLQKHVVQN